LDYIQIQHPSHVIVMFLYPFYESNIATVGASIVVITTRQNALYESSNVTSGSSTTVITAHIIAHFMSQAMPPLVFPQWLLLHI